MRSTHRTNLLAIALLGCLSGPAFALATDKDQPLDLEADSAEIDEGKGMSVYVGNVIATQGSMRLESDRLVIYHTGTKAERIEAEGKPARFQQLTDDSPEPVKARLAAEYPQDKATGYAPGMVRGIITIKRPL